MHPSTRPLSQRRSAPVRLAITALLASTRNGKHAGKWGDGGRTKKKRETHTGWGKAAELRYETDAVVLTTRYTHTQSEEKALANDVSALTCARGGGGRSAINRCRTPQTATVHNLLLSRNMRFDLHVSTIAQGK